MRKFDSRFIKNKVAYLLKQAEFKVPPVNLVPVARFQRVLTIELRPMLIGGCIEPVEGGFNVYIRDKSTRSLSLNDSQDVSFLSPRQRFTLAHEIAHTFFYDLSLDPPQVSKQAPKSQIVEWLCQQGASQLLLPEYALKQELTKSGPVGLHMAVKLGKIFRASTEAVIRRMDELDDAKTHFRALLLVKLNQDKRDAQIRAVCYHPSLVPLLPRPKLYSNLSEWLSVFHEDEFWTEGMWDYKSERGGGTLFIKKRSQLTGKDAFFIEVLFEPEVKEPARQAAAGRAAGLPE